MNQAELVAALSRIMSATAEEPLPQTCERVVAWCLTQPLAKKAAGPSLTAGRVVVVDENTLWFAIVAEVLAVPGEPVPDILKRLIRFLRQDLQLVPGQTTRNETVYDCPADDPGRYL